MLLHQYISCNSDKYLFRMGSYESVLERYPELYRHLQGKVNHHNITNERKKKKSSVIYIMVHPAVAILGE